MAGETDSKAVIAQIKGSIKNENVSYSEIAWLQEHQDEVLEDGDIELAQWAGISEEVYRGRNN